LATNPLGCYLKKSSGSLWYNPNGDANDDDTDRVSICIEGEPPVATPAPTPPATPIVAPPATPIIAPPATPIVAPGGCKGARFCITDAWCESYCQGGANPVCTTAGGGFCVCGSVPAPSTTPVPPVGNTWDATKVYNTGDTCSYNGVTYKASWWTKGEQPSDGGPWKAVA